MWNEDCMAFSFQNPATSMFVHLKLAMSFCFYSTNPWWYSPQQLWFKLICACYIVRISESGLVIVGVLVLALVC